MLSKHDGFTDFNFAERRSCELSEVDDKATATVELSYIQQDLATIADRLILVAGHIGGGHGEGEVQEPQQEDNCGGRNYDGAGVGGHRLRSEGGLQ